MSTAPTVAAVDSPAAKPGLIAELKAAFAALSANKKLADELVAARARVTELEAANAAAAASIATLTEAASTAAAASAAALTAAQTSGAAIEANAVAAQAAFDAVLATLGLKAAELAAKKPEELQAAFAGLVNTRAAEQLAELGFDAAALIPATSGEGTGNKDLAARMNEITDPAARAAFYEANKAAFFGPN
jgi:hypothetical protein